MNNKYLMSVTEAAKYFSIGRDKLYQLIKSDTDIPVLKIGSNVKINVPMMEKWLNDCVNEGRDL